MAVQCTPSAAVGAALLLKAKSSACRQASFRTNLTQIVGMVLRDDLPSSHRPSFFTALTAVLGPRGDQTLGQTTAQPRHIDLAHTAPHVETTTSIKLKHGTFYDGAANGNTYGPLPGVQAQTLTDVTQLAAATAWRSRRIDPTGFYWLGARYYEPTSGRFLSADPMGHAASPSLYDYAGGDPVNHTDSDGRLATKIANVVADPYNGAAWNDVFKAIDTLNAFNEQRYDELIQKYGQYLNAENGGFFETRADAQRAMIINTALGQREGWEYQADVIDAKTFFANMGILYFGPQYFVTPAFSNWMVGEPRTDANGTPYISEFCDPWFNMALGPLGVTRSSDGIPTLGYPNSAIRDSAHSHPPPEGEGFSGNDQYFYGDKARGNGLIGNVITPLSNVFSTAGYESPVKKVDIIPQKDLQDIRDFFGKGRL